MSEKLSGHGNVQSKFFCSTFVTQKNLLLNFSLMVSKRSFQREGCCVLSCVQLQLVIYDNEHSTEIVSVDL